MKRLVYILLAALALTACSRGRMIPDGKLEDIYYEMFLADQWMRMTSGMEEKADTTFFYEPIFRAHGYSLKDYDYTVQRKLRDPEGFSKLLKNVSERLQKEADRLSELKTAADSVREILSRVPYYPQDFSYPMFSTDGYVNYYEQYKNKKQYGFDGKIQLFLK